jgi:hypothetical protein
MTVQMSYEILFLFMNSMYEYMCGLGSCDGNSSVPGKDESCFKRDLNTLWLLVYVGDHLFRPPLWSSGQSSWLQIQMSRFRFPALPDFLRSSGSGTGITRPREDN